MSANCLGNLHNNYLNSQFNRLNSLIGSKVLNPLIEELANLQNELNEFILSPVEDILNFLNEVNSKIDEIVPNFANDQCFQDVNNIIKNCSGLDLNPIVSTPSNYMKALASTLSNRIINMLGQIANNLSEFLFSSALMNFISALSNISNILNSMLGIADCLGAGSGSSQMEIINEKLNSVSMTLFPSGTIGFDYDSFFSGNMNKQSQIMTVYNKTDEVLIIGKNRIQEASEFFKIKSSVMRITKTKTII